MASTKLSWCEMIKKSYGYASLLPLHNHLSEVDYVITISVCVSQFLVCVVDDYFLSRLPIVEKRLAQGGVRLAATLNRIFTSQLKIDDDRLLEWANAI